MTDLSGSQISSLLETLPGIAQVLRSPVADAFINLIRAGTGQGPFNLADAEEVMHYAVRRNLLAANEGEQIVAEAREIVSKKGAPAARKSSPEPRKKAARPARKPARKPIRKAPRKPARKPARKAPARKARPAPKVHKKK